MPMNTVSDLQVRARESAIIVRHPRPSWLTLIGRVAPAANLHSDEAVSPEHKMTRCCVALHCVFSVSMGREIALPLHDPFSGLDGLP